MPISGYIRQLREKVGQAPILMLGVTGVVIDGAGEILLQLRSDNRQWALPGGALDPSEEPAEAVVREVWEETGVLVQPERVVAVHGGEDFFTRYPNGDQVYIVSITFACRPLRGEPRVNDDESLEVRYFPPDQLPPISERTRLRIQLTLQNDLRCQFRYTPKPLGDYHP
ncbi:MAG: NUDIX domain-containing protein [Chloroflexi bacterium]|nr:NUDIX domain-containing protein [Chloroflexota bacterium]